MRHLLSSSVSNYIYCAFWIVNNGDSMIHIYMTASIREYGSTLYVGMAPKKMASHKFQLQLRS